MAENAESISVKTYSKHFSTQILYPYLDLHVGINLFRQFFVHILLYSVSVSLYASYSGYKSCSKCVSNSNQWAAEKWNDTFMEI